MRKIATVVMSLLVSVVKDAPIETFYSNFMVNIMCEAVAVFVISFTISAILNNIPVLKKYIV